MEFNKEKIQDLMEDWIIFRDEEISRLTEEDKEHLIDFDKYYENIMKNVSPVNKKYVQKQFEALDNNYLDYIGMINIIELVLAIA